MAGVSIEAEIRSKPLQMTFYRLLKAMGDTTPVMRAIGVGLVRNTHLRFRRSQAPDGSGWAALSPGYAEIKRGAGILRESAMRGGLMGSITSQPSSDRVSVGTNKIYGAVHQFGATIRAVNAPRLAFMTGGGLARPTEVTIPARPFLGISDQDERLVEETVQGFLVRALR